MTPAEREARILSLEPEVQKIARGRVGRLPPWLQLQELVSAGWLGAIQAVDGFDPERHRELIVYAGWKIRSAIADYLRSIDPLTRDHRRGIRRGEVPAPITLCLDPRYSRDYTDVPTPGAITHIPDARAAAGQAALDARISLRSLYARTELNPRNARVLKRCMEGELLSDIGDSIGVTQGRVSQICKRAIAQLRAAA